MKYSFKILCLLSVIAFTGVMLSRSDGGGQYSDNTQQTTYTTDQSGDTGAVNEFPTLAILPAMFHEMPLQCAETSNDGLYAYSWENDKREEIRRSCQNILFT